MFRALSKHTDCAVHLTPTSSKMHFGKGICIAYWRIWYWQHLSATLKNESIPGKERTATNLLWYCEFHPTCSGRKAVLISLPYSLVLPCSPRMHHQACAQEGRNQAGFNLFCVPFNFSALAGFKGLLVCFNCIKRVKGRTGLGDVSLQNLLWIKTNGFFL